MSILKLILILTTMLAPGTPPQEPAPEPEAARYVCVRDDLTRVVDGKLRRELEAKGYTCTL